MKIRWKNTLIVPNTSEKWMLFSCKYPVVYLIVSIIISCIGLYFYNILSDFENGNIATVYVGKLKVMYDIFGKWGIVGFFIFVAFCILYLFWTYAISQPKTNFNQLNK